MTINIQTLSATNKKKFLNNLVKCLSQEDSQAVKAIFAGQKIVSIDQLLFMSDTNILDMKLIDESVDADGNKILIHTVVPMLQLQHIQNLKKFAIHIDSASSDITNVDAIKTEAFNEYMFNVTRQTQDPVQAPATAEATALDENTQRQIEGIPKKDARQIVTAWSGGIHDYASTMRKTEASAKAHGMGLLFLVSTVPPTNDGSKKWELWDAQNQFLSAAMIVRWTGGQAAVIIRKHSNDPNPAFKMLCEIKKHYESHQNKSAAITQLLTQLTALKYTTRSNFSITKHLNKFQELLQDLVDNGHLIGDTESKSMLCNSINHHSFAGHIDRFLDDPNMTTDTMITQLSQKATRLETPRIPRRSMNNQRTNGRQQNNRGNRPNNRRNNHNNQHNKDSPWWVEPTVWDTWTPAQKADHNRRRKAARNNGNGNNRNANPAPVPASNYGQAQLNAAQMLQLLAMTDAQRAQVQAAMTQLAQVNQLRQALPAPVANAVPAQPVAAVQHAAAAVAPPNPAVPTAANTAGVNLLTQLLNAPAPPNGQARLFNTTTRIVTDADVLPARTRNPTIPKRKALGHEYLLDTTDMEPTEFATYEDLSLVSTSSVSDDQSMVDSVPDLVDSPFNYDSSDDESSVGPPPLRPSTNDDPSIAHQSDDDSWDSIGPPPVGKLIPRPECVRLDDDSSIDSSTLPPLLSRDQCACPHSSHDDSSIATSISHHTEALTFLDDIPTLVPLPVPTTSTGPIDMFDPDVEHFSDALEAPIPDVANDLELFCDAEEDFYFEPNPSSLVPPMELCSPDTFLVTGDRLLCSVRQANFSHTRYLHGAEILHDGYSPIDGGADTIFCGNDTCYTEEFDEHRKVEVVNCHGTVERPPYNVGTNLTVTETVDGERILLRMHETICGDGKTLFSANHIRAAGHIVDDVPKKFGGKQRIKLFDGPTIPLHYKNALVQLKSSHPTADELATLPVYDLTIDVPWNPTQENDDDDAGVAPSDLRDANVFATKYLMISDDAELKDDVIADAEISYNDTYSSWIARLNRMATRAKQSLKTVDWASTIPRFAWKPQEVIEKTYDCTTQYYRTTSERLPMRQYFKSRTPALRVTRLNERVSTDWIDSSVASINGGFTGAQIFYGCTSKRITVYGGHGPGGFPDHLKTYIKEIGAPHTLMSDSANVEASETVNKITREYAIKQEQSEPHKQNQNKTERPIQDLKKDTVKLLDRTGAPSMFWFYALLYLVALHNCTANAVLGWITPLEKSTGLQPDISWLKFAFYEPVYYLANESYSFPDSKELVGRWLGPAEHVGDTFCSYILTTKNTVIKRSVLRPAHDQSLHANKRQTDGEELLNSTSEPNQNFLNSDTDATEFDFDPLSVIGYEFIHEQDGHGYRAKVTDYFEDQKKFMISLGDGAKDEIISYNEMIDAVNRRMDDSNGTESHETLWFLDSVVDHELKPDGKHLLKVMWSTGETTWEPLRMMAEDDPVTVAKYAKDHNLLNVSGFKRFKRLASREKKFIRMLRQAFASKRKNAIKYKFGVRIPRNLKEAKELDRVNGNTLWQDALKKEMDQIASFETFKDLGKGARLPAGHQRVYVHIVWDCKYDLRRKARLVISGNLTPPTTDNAYSGIVSLDGVRTVMFLAELNGLQLCAADIGNAYLTSKTREKLCIIAGPEFGALEGHTLLLYKACYGTRTGGNRFAEKLADDLMDLGFFQSQVDPAIWMKDCGDHYEYLCTWVDDLLFASKNPMWLMDQLQKKCGYVLKGVGTPEYYLGADIKRVDKDDIDSGVLTMGSTTYVKRCLDNYEKLLGLKPPKKVSQPLDPKYYPELDESDLLDERGRKIYWSLIGMLQWAVTIGRIDIHHAVMCMSRFRAQPRKGHMQAVTKIFGYLSNYRTASIKFRTDIPDYSKFELEQQTDFDWSYIYGTVKEMVPEGLPTPKGKPVRISLFVDANLGHDKVTGRSCSGIITMLNLTPMDFFCKLQNTVETATFGSEATVGRQGSDKGLAERYKLRALGVPIDGPTYMFGDNKSVVLSATVPTHKLNKRHNFLAYHRLRECIAATHNGQPVLRFYHIDGKHNPADIQTKSLPGSEIYRHMKPWLHWVDRNTTTPSDSQQMGSINMAG